MFLDLQGFQIADTQASSMTLCLLLCCVRDPTPGHVAAIQQHVINNDSQQLDNIQRMIRRPETHSDRFIRQYPHLPCFIYIISAALPSTWHTAGTKLFPKSNFSITNLPLFHNSLEHQLSSESAIFRDCRSRLLVSPAFP